MRTFGMTAGLALVVLTGAARAEGPKYSRDEAALRQAEENFRAARVARDTGALDTLLTGEFYGINQNGNARTKAQILELFKTFPIEKMTVDVHRVRVSGKIATVAGRQSEVAGAATAPARSLLFLRTYVRGKRGWQLLNSVQFVDPKGPDAVNTSFAYDQW